MTIRAMSRRNFSQLVAYILLVLVVAGTSWRIDDALDKVENDICQANEAIVLNRILNLAAIQQIPDFPEEFVDVSIEIYARVQDSLEIRCGILVLDELPLETIVQEGDSP